MFFIQVLYEIAFLAHVASVRFHSGVKKLMTTQTQGRPKLLLAMPAFHALFVRSNVRLPTFRTVTFFPTFFANVDFGLHSFLWVTLPYVQTEFAFPCKCSRTLGACEGFCTCMSQLVVL